MKNIVVIDCYTDEPAGLSVPPYVGTYERYIFGVCEKHNINPSYITIDDLRSQHINNSKDIKTNINIINTTNNKDSVNKLLQESDIIIVICGSHTPGKYLQAHPGTTTEILKYIENNSATKILCGPAASEYDSTHEGGKVTKDVKDEFDHCVSGDIELFLDEFLENEDIAISKSQLRTYEQLKDYTSANVINQISDKNIICEIEMGRGCPRQKGCSFCTEWKRFQNTIWREPDDIIFEVKELYDQGVRHFRLGRQSCFYSYKNNSPKEIEKLLKGITDACPDIETLHIDNANAQMVVTKEGEEITKLICKYCTDQNVAAFGVESFDPIIQERNNLNCTNEVVLKAIEIINKYGSENNKFLPGINIIFGLDGETKKTHEWNMKLLTEILDKYKLRRINVRTVAPLPGTDLYNQCGSKYLRKNKKYYWKWRNDIRQNIDFPMLQKVYPKNSIIKNVITRVHDGNHTFGQQLGSYPIVCGLNKRIDLNQKLDLKVIGHNLRSLICEEIKKI